MHGAKNLPKIRVNHQMNDVILLDSASQVTIFKQKDYVEIIFISKRKHCTQFSGEGKSCSYLRYKIAGAKGDHMFDEESMSKILFLVDAIGSHRVVMDTIFDDTFHARTTKGIAR